MRRIGKVIHLSRNRKLITRLEENSKLPKIKDKVFNSKLNSVGVVEDIFGPENSPYLAVKLEAKTENIAHLIEKPLYTKKNETNEKDENR